MPMPTSQAARDSQKAYVHRAGELFCLKGNLEQIQLSLECFFQFRGTFWHNPFRPSGESCSDLAEIYSMTSFNNKNISYPINILNHFLGQILFKLAAKVLQGKNGTLLGCFIFKINMNEDIRVKQFSRFL
jgi:hypothetical protein